MALLRWPGLIDPHVHVREPGATHKEDWSTATAAALAGGFTAILTMPNTSPPVTEASSLGYTLRLARAKARCDYAQYLGATAQFGTQQARLAPYTAGLKLYLSPTFGPLWLSSTQHWHSAFRLWPAQWPLVVHAERVTLAAALFFARLYERPLHVAHVAYREEIALIRGAKERGWPVTCEVTPHHLLLTQEDVRDLKPGWSEVRPRLGNAQDREALWQHLDVIDVFATDHAPHTREEKSSSQPPPGFPGLETALPLLISAFRERGLPLEGLVERMHSRVRHLWHLPQQEETWIEIDSETRWELPHYGWHTRADWSPFAGWRVQGRVVRVVLRGREVYREGRVLAPPGFGQPLRPPLSAA